MNCPTLCSFVLATSLATAMPVTATAHVSPTAADTGRDVAEIMAEASAAFEAQDYEAALKAFEAAYDVANDPNFLFNIGRVHEEAGNLPLAVQYYERFMGHAGVEIENRQLAFQRVQVLKPIVEQQARARQTPPHPGGAGTATDRPPSDGRGLLVSGAALSGLGGALLLGGGIFAGLGRRDARQVDSAQSPDERDALERSAVGKATAGDALLIGGGVVLAVGVPLLITGLIRRHRSRRDSARAFRVVPNGRGLTAAFRF